MTGEFLVSSHGGRGGARRDPIGIEYIPSRPRRARAPLAPSTKGTPLEDKYFGIIYISSMCHSPLSMNEFTFYLTLYCSPNSIPSPKLPVSASFERSARRDARPIIAFTLRRAAPRYGLPNIFVLHPRPLPSLAGATSRCPG